MTPKVNADFNPRAPQSHRWPPCDCEQWLKTMCVAGKIRGCGILGPVVTRLQGRFISSQSGPPWPPPGSADEVSRDAADPCAQMGEVRPNQTTHSPLPAALQAAPSPDTPGRGCSKGTACFAVEGGEASSPDLGAGRKEPQKVQSSHSLTPDSCLSPGPGVSRAATE